MVLDGGWWRRCPIENGSSLASELDGFTWQQRQPPKAQPMRRAKSVIHMCEAILGICWESNARNYTDRALRLRRLDHPDQQERDGINLTGQAQSDF